MTTDSSRKYQHHTIAFKRALVQASLEPGISMAALARTHGVNANQLWSWRKLYNEGRLGAGKDKSMLDVAPALPTLVAVDVISEQAQPAAALARKLPRQVDSLL